MLVLYNLSFQNASKCNCCTKVYIIRILQIRKITIKEE